ncbi:MAG TPA: bifunctional [glutamate--ammonia ligase]-adenylyl-L-tyrosine phosphorylase/[glutamate--ammonia-ligase] adenylyltransferase, partial [Arenimonas sp.]|nr:bifunctional [glutamate--ammonia ligase]-adenylyl-L-tyrosine phosphorylase/[glutamate--ammonia-ligase] adenylyltransferase [Arenimonas sp.]
IAYRFLRRLENRVQMLADQQVHELPGDAEAQLRIAWGLGHDDAAALRAALDAERAVVSEEFDRLLEARRQRQAPNALSQYWRALPDGGEPAVLRDAGFADAESADAALRDFAQGPGVRTLSARGRSRLDHVLPLLLAAAALSSAPAMALKRGLALLQAVLRRTSYLALLEEQPAALARLVDVTARSALLAERLAAHPLLLDELLDSRVAALPDEPEIIAGIDALQLPENDLEAALQQLAEYRQSCAFRIALATLAQRQPAQASARQLATLAEAVLAACLRLVRTDIESAHGRIDRAGFAVIGYGSIGGREFGFGSDLDLVFLHDAPLEAMSDGARPLDASRYFARLAQKLVSLLGTVTGAGKLYEVDVRLRPDGAKGLLVSTVASFGDYQRERAWTWERQALVRARALAGDAAVCAAFESIRRDTLCQTRDASALRDDVVAMRRRMRGELDRGDAARFDLKQGESGLVDLEFLLQAEVLQRAAAEPALCEPRDTPGLLAALGCDAELAAAHALLLARGLDCTLDQRPRLVAYDESLEGARAVVREACLGAGLDFR